MYKPNFCCECGAKLLRLRWYVWTSRKFCGKCARRLRKARLFPVLWIVVALIGAGYVAGRFRSPAPPPLIIERRRDSPLSDSPQSASSISSSPVGNQSEANTAARLAEETIYQCGALTKKGTPCSRRVHGPVRCWQHKGMPAMKPQEELLVKD